MKGLFFSLLVAGFTQMAILTSCSISQTKIPKPNWQFKTDDTHLTIAVVNNRQVIYELKNPVNGWNWTSRPSEVPLLDRITFTTTDSCIVDPVRYPDWTYRDAVTDSSDGYKVTLRFTSANPELELKSIWQARKGCGPVEHWMTVENKSGKEIMYSHCDVKSTDLTVAADKKVKLWRFYRQPIGKPNGGLEAIRLEADSRILSIVSNEVNHGDPDKILPFEMIDVGSAHGLYLGFGWNFGRFVTTTGKDPRVINTMFNLGDIGNITENEGQILYIPYTFYGTYIGDADDGSNRMKKWFWNNRMTKTLRENKNEPLVELHAPYYDKAGWTTYLENHPLKSWGVDLIKVDIAWMLPGSFSTWVNEVEKIRNWDPDPGKWPKGVTFGDIAHANNLKASLYMPNSYQSANLGTKEGREAQKQILSERYDKGWYDYWRTDGMFNSTPFNYHAHEGFLEIVDFLIANKPGFRWEACGGGGCLKSFDIAERMTFLTIEDYGRPHTYRMAYYGNSYVFNPVQLKADVSVDWGLGSGLADSTLSWDKYAFRTGLMGSIMVCGSEREMDDQEEGVARETWNLYHTKQRAILRGTDVYHILPFPDGVNWDGMQFFNTEINKGSVLLFKPSESSPDSKVINFKGLDRTATYKLTFEDRKDQNTSMTGAELMDSGIEVKGMSGNFASEIIWIN